MIHVKAFQAAAKWWADHLRDINYKHQTGDDKMDMFATVQLATRPKLKNEQIDAFESELEKKLVKSYKDWIKMCEFGDIDFRNKYYSIDIDYEPCGVLLEAAKKAGLSARDMALRLPVKSGMGIKPTCVIVSAGYQQDYQTIYKSAS
ncbi:MAG: hypothetical protein NTY99_00580 [DPANN group archaeon]|nr:hypothetical protein [DPANN group archaeon]